jgi:hypothetical protein
VISFDTTTRARRPLDGGERTDLLIFRTPVMRSHSIATVLDLRWRIHAVIGVRRRTNVNETEIETEQEP